ncbi:AAA family ATPase [Ornithinibacillus halotolerans]|uniref:Nuclease SbcCD subunit C n=1 Tax=Ornithinibacillus halotolerans TaxID=1274357 RepID=A0A916W9X3_9BACI|nr:SMC family ATPase [Ornithinibacillus halotolerans]GGA79995.1 nuclease SbcCD subunit C [Ornithinibacillus halotolerans]
MKPLTLKMTAFGPYKYTETIDFRELDQHHLFVISGNTGAGKTTIFDGISFALYGSASGSDRENNKMLRSDFADDDTHTAVELTFELQGRTYRILRQLGHVKQGNKTKTGERYEFYEQVDGEEIPCVDRQIVSEINEKVESLIGLTQDQFKQIVMLPQGEFRKLLTSETENKEAILRRLFKTDNYKQINEILKKKRDAVEREHFQIKQTRDNYVQSIGTALPRREDSLLFDVLSEEYKNINQIDAGLEEEITFYEKQIVIDKENYEQAYKTHDKKQKELNLAEALNERFTVLEQKEAEFKQLEGQVPLFKQKEKQLEEAERASQIEFYEKQVKSWRKEEKEKVTALHAADNLKKTAEEKLSTAQARYEAEESKKDVREETAKKLTSLHEFVPLVQDIEERKQALEVIKTKGIKAKSDFEQARNELVSMKQGLDNLTEEIKRMDLAVGELPDKQNQLTDMREKAVLLRDYIQTRDKQTTINADLKEKQVKFEKANAAYQEMEEAWLSNQASQLAVHLHDGEACPVCGSVEHPNKATNNNQEVTKETLDTLKKDRDEKDTLYRTVLADQKSNGSLLKERGEALQNRGIDPTHADAINKELVAEGKRLAIEVEELQKLRKKVNEEKEKQDKLNQLIKQLEIKKEKFEKEYQEQITAYQTTKAVYKERLGRVPVEVRALSELEKQIRESENQKMLLEKAWEEAQKAFQTAKDEMTKAESNLGHATKQLAETKAKLEHADEEFQAALTKAGFSSEEVYKEAKLSEGERQTLKEGIRQFNEKIGTLKQQLLEIKEELKDKQKVDLSELKEQVSELKEAYELALNKLNLSKEYHKDAIDLKTKILEAHEQVIEQEKQFSVITDLYNVVRGHNDKKISFERYLLIEYLEQIIDAANGRLRRLSNGQFYLIRSDRQESHGRQSGLALDVFDTYTGQTRDVKTLSGGEKFNASLCLALGMSDVIQSFQGNISIQTMFIDEGFGSLDEESLHKSIDTLIELQQSGRMIGVISHVKELKAMFPAVLEVKKTKEGYSRTAFAVK